MQFLYSIRMNYALLMKFRNYVQKNDHPLCFFYEAFTGGQIVFLYTNNQSFNS